MRHIFQIALWLTEADPDKRMEVFARNRSRGLMLYLKHSKHLAAPGPFHKAIDAVLGQGVTRTRLYVAGNLTGDPSYCITVVKSEDSGLWHTAAMAPKPIAATPKAGILVHFPADSDSALTSVPPMTRTYGASPISITNMRRVIGNYESRRLASHCYLIGQAFGALYRGGSLPIQFEGGGRVLLWVGAGSADGYVEPLEMEVLNDSVRAGALAKPRIVFYGDAGGDEWRGPETEPLILPCVREDLIIEELRHDDPYISTKLNTIATHTLLCGVMPILEIVYTHPCEPGIIPLRTVDTVIAHYIPKDQTTHRQNSEFIAVVVDKEGRYINDSIPKIHIEGNRVFPSRSFMRVLYAHLSSYGNVSCDPEDPSKPVDPQDDSIPANHRVNVNIDTIFTLAFGLRTLEDVIALFKENKVTLAGVAARRLEAKYDYATPRRR